MSLDPSRIAVVIGASLAGLNAAAALADHFAQVIVVERDAALPADGQPRRGVPQGHHVHALLLQGLASMEARAPGFSAALEAAGGVRINQGLDCRWYAFGGHRPRYASGCAPIAMSRPGIEAVLRRLVLARPNVVLRGGLALRDLCLDGDRVVGVLVGAEGGAVERIACAVVVDCSGRASRMPRILEGLGFPAPREEIISSKAVYASRVYRRLPAAMRRWELAYVQPGAAVGPRGGIVAPMEGDLCMVTLLGMAGEVPPTDEAGFLAFARSLPGGEIASFLHLSEPVGPIHSFGRAENRRRAYEALDRRVEGLLVMGDAATALNPIYGQGMTAAALSADALAACLRAQTRGGALGVKGLAARFAKAQAAATAVAWEMATNEDLRWPLPENSGRLGIGARLLGRYVDAVQRATLRSPVVCEAFLRVANLLDAPTALLRPGFLWSLLRSYAAGPAPALTVRTV